MPPTQPKRPYLREDMAIIQAGVVGVDLPGVYSWTSLEGGVLESSSVFTRPGGMQKGFQIGGPQERTDVTVHRQMTVDLVPYIFPLEKLCGNAEAWVTWTLQDHQGNPQGSSVGLTGVLKQVQHPNFDGNASAAAFFGLVIAVDQEASSS